MGGGSKHIYGVDYDSDGGGISADSEAVLAEALMVLVALALMELLLLVMLVIVTNWFWSCVSIYCEHKTYF